MFSSLINSAKNAVAGLAETAESGSSAAPEAPPPQQQPAASAPSEKPKEGGDFFSGLLDVAKEVGKTIGENTEKGAESVKDGANAAADSTKNTAEGAAQMTKEDLEKLKQGIGALVGQASEAYQKYSSKSEENIEEEVSCVDSKGGKVQLPSVVEKEKMAEQSVTKEEEKGSDFFSGLLSAAKEVGKTIGESTEKGAESVKEGAGAAAESTKNTAEGAAQMTKEDLEKLKQGIGALVGQASQAYQKYSAKTEENVEEQVSRVDSEGGKVQLPSVLEEEKAINKTATPEEGKGSDFFAGLLSAAKEVGKTIGESTEKGAESVKEGAGAAATGTKQTAEGAAQMTKEDLDKITQGLGSLVGKATEAYHNFSSGDKKPTDAKEEDKQKEATQDFDKISQPVVDDIEGEIPMVVTGGYTGQVEKKDSGLCK